MQNLVHETIPTAVLDAFKEAVLNARDKIAPYAIGLTDKQRRDLYKMGEKSVSFVEKTGEYLNEFPDYTPRRVDTDQFRADLTLFQSLRAIKVLADALQQTVDDLMMAAGSDMMESSSAYYRSVQDAAEDGDASATAIYDELRKRFPYTGLQGTTPPPNNTPAAS